MAAQARQAPVTPRSQIARRQLRQRRQARAHNTYVQLHEPTRRMLFAFASSHSFSSSAITSPLLLSMSVRLFVCLPACLSVCSDPFPRLDLFRRLCGVRAQRAPSVAALVSLFAELCCCRCRIAAAGARARKCIFLGLTGPAPTSSGSAANDL